MDRIENLIRGLDPLRAERESSGSATEIIPFPAGTGYKEPEPGASATTGEDENDAFSDDHPVVVPLRRRRATVMILTGAAAVAVVAGAVVVGGSLRADEPLPAGSTDPTPTLEPSLEPTAQPSPSPAAASEDPSAEPDAVPTGPPADEGCRVEDVDRVMEQGSDFMSLTPFAADPEHYAVVGCTADWMAMEITDTGFEANPQDGGNAWFYIARRIDGQWLVESASYSTIVKWDFLPVVAGRTPQEMMDQQFVDAGIPVELRPALVGEGPGADAGSRPLRSDEMGLAYELPTSWSVVETNRGGLDLMDSSGTVVANIQRSREGGLGGACLEGSVHWREIRSVPVTVDTPSGTVGARFVLRLFEGEVLVGGTGLVAEQEPASGNQCMLYNVISQPAVGVLSLGSHFQLSPHQEGNGTVFATVSEAETYAQSAEFNQLASIAESIVVSD